MVKGKVGIVHRTIRSLNSTACSKSPPYKHCKNIK